MKLNFKHALMKRIGNLLDEDSLPGIDSFIEIDECVIHFVVDGEDLYFEIVLTQVDESEYWKKYNPEKETKDATEIEV